MNEKNINCVVIHKGYQPYLRHNLEITSKNNKVYLIGDSSVEVLGNISNNVKFLDIKKFQSNEKIKFFKENFKNYSTNSFEFEWFCFERVLLIESFMEEFGLEKVFHIDSDNILLTNINDLNFTSNNAYVIPANKDRFTMAGSIHAGLIDMDFCTKFSELYEDIYINKSKFDLIEKKIQHHKVNEIAGGICDMTLYFLLYDQKFLSIQNLLIPFHNISGEEYVFMNNYNLGEGYFHDQNFEMKKGRIKIYNGNSINDLVNNKKIKIANIHYQGKAKKYLNRFTKFKLSV